MKYHQGWKTQIIDSYIEQGIIRRAQKENHILSAVVFALGVFVIPTLILILLG